MNKKINTDRKTVRCAIYTRKSTEEGLQLEFNTLDAQRESSEAYIAAQKHEGWVCLPDRYDDGGFTGGNLERPAVQRLMKDIEAGRIDCVVVYKVDRLSRSLMDFARIMAIFENHDVSFVSVTQQFNTTHSMGRLTLNILLSFAQFEREIISERTRDKIAAARRKGKFAGGKPVLGYDLLSSPAGSKLLVNEDEADQVRGIFALYLEHQGLISVVKELNRRSWGTKVWVTKSGRAMGGRPFDKNLLYHLLTNVIYTGNVRYRDEVYPGEHDAIVDEGIWQKVQATLQRNHRTGGALVRNRYGVLLKGLLRCACCDCAMSHTYSAHQSRRYRYYVCMKAQKRGWAACASKAVPAGEMERFVIEQIKAIGQDPQVLGRTIQRMQYRQRKEMGELKSEERSLQRELIRRNQRLHRLVQENPQGQHAQEQDRIGQIERRISGIGDQRSALSDQVLDQRQVEQALGAFMPLWEALSPREQGRMLHLLIERVDYDGKEGTIRLTFRPNGIKTLAQPYEEVAA